MSTIDHPAGVRASPRSRAIFAIVAGTYLQTTQARPDAINLPDEYRVSLLKRVTGQIVSMLKPDSDRANLTSAIEGGLHQARHAHANIEIGDSRPFIKRLVGQIIAHRARLVVLDARPRPPSGGSASC
jgi:hypothetical protein